MVKMDRQIKRLEGKPLYLSELRPVGRWALQEGKMHAQRRGSATQTYIFRSCLLLLRGRALSSLSRRSRAKADQLWTLDCIDPPHAFAVG